MVIGFLVSTQSLVSLWPTHYPQLKCKHKTTWMHPQSKHWHLPIMFLSKRLTSMRLPEWCAAMSVGLINVSSTLRSAFAPQPDNRNLSIGLRSAAWAGEQICSAYVQPYRLLILHRSLFTAAVSKHLIRYTTVGHTEQGCHGCCRRYAWLQHQKQQGCHGCCRIYA